MSTIHGIGVNSAPLNFTTDASRNLFEQYLMETPLKREGYEDARLGSPARQNDLTEKDGLKYEEGRVLYFELKAYLGREPPQWLTPRPSTKLIRACLKWDKAHPGQHLLPPTFRAD